VHPTITNEEVTFICNSLKELTRNIDEWSKDYSYIAHKNDYVHNTQAPIEKELVANWFSL
jgi:hypothetical protein